MRFKHKFQILKPFAEIYSQSAAGQPHPALLNDLKNSLRSLQRGMLLLTSLILSTVAGAAGDLPSISGDPFDVLDPEEAFVIDVVDTQPTSVAINFAIEEGYYLYRKKISVEAAQPGLDIITTESAPGIETEDEFFGKTEIYRNSTDIIARFNAPESTSGTPATAKIKLHYQGCADIGICYPPQEKVLSISIPAANGNTSPGSTPGQGNATPDDSNLTRNDSASALSEGNSTPGSSPLSVTDKLASLLGDDEPELLPPDIAFVPSVGTQVNDTLPVRFAIEEGYYLYKDKISATLIDADGAQIRQVSLQKGKLKDDAYFGRVEVFRNSTEATLLLENISKTTSATLSVNYQGCADIGVCFPPQTTTLPVSLLPVAAISTSAAAPIKIAEAKTVAAVSNTSVSSTAVPQSEQDRLASTLSTSSIWIIIATFFGLGLLLAFTPCVFPMVPILSSLIVGQGDSITTKKAFALSLTYVLAMALTYTIAGVIVGLSGENIQVWFQNPWVLSGFALLFVLLSLSMFGFYELQMPNAIQQKLNGLSNNAEGGTFIGAGIMGFLSALIVGPCVTAPLVGALIFIANTGDALVGGAALFALSMGMGAPLLIIGASCGKLLPKSGAWMNATKAVFGVLLLALAIWMLSRIMPASITMALSATLLIVSGIYLGATDALSPGVSGWRKLSKGMGLVVLVYGMTLLVGAVSGGHSLLKPLQGMFAAGGSGGSDSSGNSDSAHAGELAFQRIRSVDELQQVVASAAQNQQTVMLDFYADWCISCKEMEAFTFTDQGVQQRLKNTVLIQADVTENNSDDKALLKKFGLFGPPGIIFYAPDGTEIEPARMVGFMSADKFSAHLDRFL